MAIETSLSFWIENGYNVIFRGKHGVGKTALVLEAFNKHNFRWQYFSASTMDPWVDFIGIPKEHIDENGQSFLDLIRPKHFQNDEVEAIFLDEFNRSSKKVRNAVMELIQFKSINGKKFNNLKVVWAAINPDEDDADITYDVEKLDPAQLDRFHAIIDIPYTPSADFFRQKYGKAMGETAVLWWKDLTNKEKDDVSPRRLDYAIDVYAKGGDIRFVLPKSCNVSKLIIELEQGPFVKQLEKLYAEQVNESAKEFIADENNYDSCIKAILAKPDYRNFFMPLMSSEKLSSLIVKHKTAKKEVFENFKMYEKVIREVAKAGGKLARSANAVIMKNDVDAMTKFTPSKTATTKDLDDACKELLQYGNLLTTGQRMRAYHTLVPLIPTKISEDNVNYRLSHILEILVTSSTVATICNRMPLLKAAVRHVNRNARKYGHSRTSDNVIEKLKQC